MNILVTGASGFVGHHVVEALLAANHSVCGVSRAMPTGNRRHRGAQYIARVDVTDHESMKQAIFDGVDIVVHLVGIIREKPPRQTFHSVHVQGTHNVLDVSKTAGVRKIIYLSAIGSTKDAPAEYSRTKAAAEALVESSGISFTILRPSIILGKDGEFVEEMEGLVKYAGLPPIPSPVIPIPGSGKSKFQPIYIDDLCQCIVKCLEDPKTAGERIEIAGATKVTFDALVDGFASRLNIRKPKVHAPVPILMLIAPLMKVLPKPPFTRDQLRNLSRDNVCDISRMKSLLGVNPIGFERELDLVYS